MERILKGIKTGYRIIGLSPKDSDKSGPTGQAGYQITNKQTNQLTKEGVKSGMTKSPGKVSLKCSMFNARRWRPLLFLLGGICLLPIVIGAGAVQAAETADIAITFDLPYRSPVKPPAPTVTWLDQGVNSRDTQIVRVSWSAPTNATHVYIDGSGEGCDDSGWIVVPTASGSPSEPGPNEDLITITFILEEAGALEWEDSGVHDNQTVEYRIKAKNAIGESNYSDGTSVTIPDRTPPSISITQPVPDITNQDVTLSITTSDDVSPENKITVTGGMGPGGVGPYTEGAHQGTLTATDEAGNYASSNTFAFTVDKTPPVITIISPTDGLITNEDVTLTYTVTDNLTEVTVTGLAMGTVYSEEGEYTIELSATDQAGNTSTVSRTFIIDKTAPVITIISPEDGLATTENVTLIYIVTENLTEITITGPISGTVYSEEGLYTIEISVTDQADNTSTVSCTFVVLSPLAVTWLDQGVNSRDTQIVRVSWSAPTNATHVYIDGSGEGCDDSGWIVVPTASGSPSKPGPNEDLITITFILEEAGALEWEDSGVHDNQTVEYRIKAKNAIGESNYSDGTSVTIPDRTPPSISITQPVPDITNQDVTLSITTSDDVSPENKITVTGGMGPGGVGPYTEGAHQGTLTATDEAGNYASSNTFAFTVDKTPPVITIISPTDGLITNEDVTLTYTVTDNLTEVTVTGLAMGTVYSEEGEYTIELSATDQAGNTSTVSRTFIIDKTPPVITVVSRLPEANTRGWNNGIVTVTYSVFDELSGVDGDIEGYEPDILTEEGEGQSATGVVTDKAGNTASVTEPGINIDLTPPVIRVASRFPVPNVNGWNNESVTVTYSVSDDLSGVDEDIGDYEPDIFTEEGGGQSATGTVTDKAGNAATATESNINIDFTPPIVTFTFPSEGLFTNQDVTLAYTLTDNLSAPEEILLVGDESSYTGEGDYTADLTVTDLAENSASYSISFRIDKTPPAITITSPPEGLLTNEDVTLQYDYSDDLSQVADIAVTGDEGPYIEDEDYTVTIMVTDEAGNTAIDIISFTIDKTLPSFAVAVSPDPASTGEVTIVVVVSELLINNPAIIVRDSASQVIPISLSNVVGYTYTYIATITGTTAEGSAAIHAGGTDLVGNEGVGGEVFVVDLTPLKGVIVITKPEE